MDFAALTPLVLPYAKGCDAGVAEINLRLAAIELCRRALVWEAQQVPVLTVADQAAYGYTPEPGQTVAKLLSVTLAGRTLRLCTPADGRSLVEAQSSDSFAYPTTTGYALNPARAAGLVLITYSAVAPSLDATALPDQLGERYGPAIARGALAKLLSMPGLTYSNAALAAEMRSLWERDDIPKAQAEASTGSSRAKRLASRRTWF